MFELGALNAIYQYHQARYAQVLAVCRTRPGSPWVFEFAGRFERGKPVIRMRRRFGARP